MVASSWTVSVRRKRREFIDFLLGHDQSYSEAAVDRVLGKGAGSRDHVRHDRSRHAGGPQVSRTVCAAGRGTFKPSEVCGVSCRKS